MALQGRYEEGSDAFRQARVAIVTNNAIASHDIVHSFQEGGLYAEAEVAHRQAIARDPDNADAHISLGAVLFKQGRFEDAEAAFHQAIEIGTDNDAIAYSNLGGVLYEQGRFEDAETATRQAVQLDPSFASAYSNLGNALRGQGRFEESEAVLRQAIQLDSDFADAYNNLGVTLEEQGRYKDAIEAYQQALRIKPDYTKAQNNLQEAERLLALRDIPQPINNDQDWLPQNEPLLPQMRAVVRIIAETPTGGGVSVGTGWVVKRDGNQLWILTNRHVLTGDQTPRLSESVEVEFYSEPPPGQFPLRRPAELLNSTEPTDDYDLALLKVNNAPNDIDPLDISSSTPGLDMDVRIIGHHESDAPWGLARGFVSNRSQGEFMQISQATVGRNSSGSPVLNDQYQVVGILVEILTPNIADGRDVIAGFSYVHPINNVVEILNRWGI